MMSRLEKSSPQVGTSRPMATITRIVQKVVLPADRSFKVLQPGRASAQLSLFPPPGLVPRNAR